MAVAGHPCRVFVNASIGQLAVAGLWMAFKWFVNPDWSVCEGDSATTSTR